MDFKKIGIAIKQERKKKKFTQQYLGERICKTESSIRKYEKGLVKIPLDVIEQIAAVLEISPFTLAGAEYFDEKFNSKKITGEVKSLEAIISYLKAIGYEVKMGKIGESESGSWEEDKDENENVIHKSWIQDEKFYEISLFKDGKSTTFTHNEFDELQKSINKTIEYQIWLKNK